MANAVFVSLAHSFPQLAKPVHDGPLAGEALRNMTCGWWHMNPASAAGVEWVLGVHQGAVVSVYRTTVPSSAWPSLPRMGVPSSDEGRVFIPAYPLAADDPREAALRALTPPAFNASSFRYATMTFAPDGSTVATSEASQLPDTTVGGQPQ